jgi:replicative DNA helicase
MPNKNQTVKKNNLKPLCSLEAEQALLGLMIKNYNPELNSQMLMLSDEDFYYKNNKIIFKTIKKLEQNTDPVDYVTVTNLVVSFISEEDDFDYKFYITELINNVSAVDIKETYAEIIKNHSVMRSLLDVMNKMSANIYNQNHPAHEMLDMVEKEIFQLTKQLQHADNLQHITGVSTLAIENIEAKEKNKGDMEFATGFTDLDKKTFGLQPGDLIIVAGRPSMGKTSFAMNIAENIATMQDKAVVLFSMEMPAESIVTRMLSAIGDIPMQHLRTGEMTDSDWIKVQDALKEINKTDVMIDASSNLSSGEIRSRTRQAARKMKKDLGLVVIDYIQLMRGNNPKESNRVQEISEISRSLKSLAVEMKVPVIVLSQLNRGVEARPNKRPVMSDLRDSGAIEQDADLILFIYRDEVYNKETEDKGVAEINIAKHRNGEIGTVRLGFIGQYTKFTNLAQNSYEDMNNLSNYNEDSDDNGFGNSNGF